MSERHPVYKKGSLLYATIVALACVMTASVSTFAWFQAEANVRISTTNSSTTISVSAPEGITLGSAVFYKYTGNGDYGYTTAISSSAKVTGEGAVFEEVSASSVSVTPAPGKKMTYCAAVTATSGTISRAGIKLKSYTVTNNANRWRLNSGKTAVDGNVSIEEAINIYAHTDTSCTGTYGSESSTDMFEFDYADPYNKSATNLTLLSSTEVTASSTIYVFFTIQFDNDSATYYEEYSATPASTPVTSSTSVSSVSRLYSTPANDTNPRYFFNSSSGNSSCYEGLTFSITSMELIAS